MPQNYDSEHENDRLSAKLTKDGELSEDEFLSVARQRFNLSADAEEETRKLEEDDCLFMVGEQWPVDIKSQRLLEKRPCLTVNRLPQFVRQITNDQRQNRPSIKVNPVDSAADLDTAKILQGMIRHIEYASHADVAYDNSFEGAAKNGKGYFRLRTDYADTMSFNQEIKVSLIKDRFAVYADPYYQEPDGSDMEWCFVVEDISKDEFCALYPDAELSSIASWESMKKESNDWVRDKAVRIAEYYYKTYETEDICLLSNGKTVKKKDLPSDMKDLSENGEEVRITSERKALVPKIKWAKINGYEILEETEILGEWIPVIPVIGEEATIDGQRVYSGIIRNVKDSQRMYNYWASAETESIALAPKAPFIGAEGQFEGHEQNWKNANTKNHPYLEYKPTTIGGQPAPPPQRNAVEPAVQAITQARMMCVEDMKGTTGIYDAALGNRSNEQSGIAIQRRNAQSQTANYHYMDNLSRSLRHAGRIMLNWIPQVYNSAQSIRIIGEDGEVKIVQINKIFKQSDEAKSHFLDSGRYDCTISTGPSYETKRQESVASMLDLTRALPQTMQSAMDLLVRNMDWPGAQEIADRLKKLLPPGLVDNPDEKPLPPQIQGQMNQMSQMIQVLTEQNKEYMEIIRTKKIEIDSKERIAAMEEKTKLAIEFMKHDQKDAAIIFEAEQNRINQELEIMNQQTMAVGQPSAQPQNIQQQPAGGNPAAMGAQ